MTPQEYADYSIYAFLEYYKITNDQSQILDFYDHPYLLDIYGDFTPKQAILKAAQIGFSTTANIKALWLAKNKAIDIIYSLPSAADIKDFVSGKTNRLINNNPILQQWVADKDSIEQKRVGNNVIYFKGTWTERAAIATPADLYISDETDRSKQEIVQQFKTRLQHSKYAWEWYFSNPSVPLQGVDAHWQYSDQKHWFVQCDNCANWDFITMANIKGDPVDFRCAKCNAVLNRRHGEWVRRWKDRDTSGYWIPSWLNPNLTARDILDKQKGYTEEQFTNFVIGKPYVGKGNVLTRPMFIQNLNNSINAQDSRPIIGVDTGKDINVVVANKYGTFYYNKTSDYQELERLMQRWPTAICIIDQGGDIIGPRKLREKFPNRVYLCFFRPSGRDDKLIKWGDDGTVVADRDRLIQMVVDEFVERRMPVYGTEADWEDYLQEWLGMYRTSEEDSLGIMKYHWNKPASGRCDYPFAQVYARIGLDRFIESFSTFHEPNNNSFAFPGMEVSSDQTTPNMFLPKNILS